MKKKIKTEFTKFPCPKCGKYFKPYLTRKDGKALCECPKHGLFQTSIKVSKNFRKFCSKIAKKPNRSPTYYSSTEMKVKKLLDENGYKEGLDYWHNVRIRNELTSHYVWLDFYLPKEDLVIEVNPRIWHRMWNRESSDYKKKQYLESQGLKVLLVNEKNYKEILKYLERNII